MAWKNIVKNRHTFNVGWHMCRWENNNAETHHASFRGGSTREPTTPPHPTTPPTTPNTPPNQTTPNHHTEPSNPPQSTPLSHHTTQHHNHITQSTATKIYSHHQRCKTKQYSRRQTKGKQGNGKGEGWPRLHFHLWLPLISAGKVHIKVKIGRSIHIQSNGVSWVCGVSLSGVQITSPNKTTQDLIPNKILIAMTLIHDYALVN